MPDLIDRVTERLNNTRQKIRTVRRDITGGTVEDKVKELGKRTFDELDRDLDGLHQAVVEGRAKAKEKGIKLYDELEADISAARTKLNEKRMDITGGVGEQKAKEAAGIIKEKGTQALKEIEEDIAKIAEKLKDEPKG